MSFRYTRNTVLKSCFIPFIPMSSRDWNSLPPTVFPATKYNLQSFKTRIHEYLQLRPNP